MKVTQLPTTTTGNASARQAPHPSAPPVRTGGIDIGKILARFEKDDYILAGLILVLVFEGCDDYILLAALGYLFLMGFKE